MSSSESEYSKAAVVIHLPLDLGLNGLLIQVYVDNSPGTFLPSLHNGFRSLEWAKSEPFAMRITHFALITIYDQKPILVPPNEYKRQRILVPTFKFGLADEIEIEFSPTVFLQIFSWVNVAKGMFRVFRLFFDSDRCRYEIIHLGERMFKVVNGGNEVMAEAEMFEFHVTRKTIEVQALNFDPVEGIVLVPHSGRLSRSGSQSRLD
jgi:hypothetical protein